MGRAVAEALLQKGIKVCIADVLQEVGEATAGELGAKCGQENVFFDLCDVSRDEQFKATWVKCEEKLGKLDLLVNNAAVGDEQNWRKTLEVNLGGCIRGCLMAYDSMSKKEGGGGGGRIINVSSMVGLKTNPILPVYCSTKYGIVGLTRALGHPLHQSLTGVKVQCLCPSFMVTSFLEDSVKTPIGLEISKQIETIHKTLPVETVAAALLQLISDDRNGGVMAVESGKEPYYVEPNLQ